MTETSQRLLPGSPPWGVCYRCTISDCLRLVGVNATIHIFSPVKARKIKTRLRLERIIFRTGLLSLVASTSTRLDKIDCTPIANAPGWGVGQKPLRSFFPKTLTKQRLSWYDVEEQGRSFIGEECPFIKCICKS